MLTIKMALGSVDIEFPAKYEVCCACGGAGRTSRDIDAGGFTGSEWEEMGADFRENYLGGLYDRTCTECKGVRVVLVVDEDEAHPADLKAYHEYLDDVREMDLENYYERRSGA